MAMIHPTAEVSSKAELANDVTIGPFTTVEENVIIDSGSTVASNAIIASGARIGRNCKIHHGAVISTIPQDLKFKGEETTLEIGDRTIIREYATLNRGTEYHWKTQVGSDCLIMSYSHVAHDCIVGDHVILANSATMAGHVTIENDVIVGGLVPIHQFVKIGQHSCIGGGFRVPKDIPPYILASGEPLSYAGLNAVGLKRNGFSSEVREKIKHAYRLVFRSKLTVSQAITRLKEEGDIPEVENIITFIENSDRGIIRG